MRGRGGKSAEADKCTYAQRSAPPCRTTLSSVFYIGEAPMCMFLHGERSLDRNPATVIVERNVGEFWLCFHGSRATKSGVRGQAPEEETQSGTSGSTSADGPWSQSPLKHVARHPPRSPREPLFSKSGRQNPPRGAPTINCIKNPGTQPARSRKITHHAMYDWTPTSAPQNHPPKIT